MPGKALKRKVAPVTAGTNRLSKPPDHDLAGASPEWLRDSVFNALRALSQDECAGARDRILSDMRNAGVNIPSGLLKLGTCARTADELSPGDIAKLVRYVRMNTPEAMKALSGILTDLIAPEDRKAKGIKPLKEAA
jgi:hypothetical protein